MWLNSYKAFYSSPDGDVPYTLSAGSIIDAARLACLPGIMAAESIEPVSIKFDKAKVGVAMPVRQIAFDTVISPSDALAAGATATPAHYDVDNGTTVIFTATEPWGFDFDGWYKEGVSDPISTDPVSAIEVYEAAKSYTKFIAKFTANYALRTGRYLDMDRGTIWDLSFDPYSIYQGRIVLDPSGVMVYYGGIDTIDDQTKKITVVADSTMQQSSDMGMSFTYEFTPVGLKFVMTAVGENLFNLEVGDQVNLKFLQP
jgi:hypothetical protein